MPSRYKKKPNGPARSANNVFKNRERFRFNPYHGPKTGTANASNLANSSAPEANKK